MKARSSFFLTAIAMCILVAGISCKKRKLNKETVTAEDQFLAENMFDDVFKVTNDMASEEQDFNGTNKTGDYSGIYSECYDVTFAPLLEDSTAPAFPRTMIVDFGTTNCEGKDGRKRRGIIEAHFTGRYRDAGTVITITTKGYHVNDHLVDGVRTLTNKGKNAADNTNYDIHVDGSVTTPDGDIISWESDRNREWIEGENTGWFFTMDDDGNYDYSPSAWNGVEGILDDVYLITGTGEGMNRDGRKFTVDITDPLRVQFCDWIPEITDGLIEIQPQDIKLRTIDFGEGSCDNTATVTVGKKSKDINFR